MRVGAWKQDPTFLFLINSWTADETHVVAMAVEVY
jgi:hypothetical protein